MVHSFGLVLGLIPAHAGKTLRPGSRWWRRPAHPRSRGENILRSRKPEARTGSSPLTRGKHCRWSFRVGKLGLIPAHAGKTHLTAASLQGPGAHPRSRGENRPMSIAFWVGMGSSPLTRGKPDGSQGYFNHARLIPAHAGKTFGHLAGHDVPPAHPRSRGENGETDDPNVISYGSSPLTRGKLRSRARR